MTKKITKTSSRSNFEGRVRCRRGVPRHLIVDTPTNYPHIVDATFSNRLKVNGFQDRPSGSRFPSQNFFKKINSIAPSQGDLFTFLHNQISHRFSYLSKIAENPNRMEHHTLDS